MAVTILALLFLVGIGAIAAVGYALVIRKQAPEGEPDLEKCSICRQKFGKEQMVLRQIGDTKLAYYCRDCILGLYSDLGMKN